MDEVIMHKIKMAIVVGVSIWALICIVVNLLFIRYMIKTRKEFNEKWGEYLKTRIQLWKK